MWILHSAIALTPMGNGCGAEGFIFPLLGLAGGGLAGTIAGAAVAGRFNSTENKTSLYHRATAVVAGATVGGLSAAALLAPLGNGAGAEGLIYPLIGLVGGALAGAIASGVAAGHYPSQQFIENRSKSVTD